LASVETFIYGRQARGGFVRFAVLARWMLLVLIFGAFLRLWGIGFGLPFIYHPGEHDLSYPAMVASLNRMHPGWFGLPSFMIDLLGGIYLVYYGFLRWLGEVPDAAGFYRLYQLQPGTFHLLGRLLAAAMGIATLPVVYRLGRWGYGRTAACWPCLPLGSVSSCARQPLSSRWTFP
jgi:hypothetical protein